MRLAAAAIIATAQALVAPTPQKTSTRLHGRATKLVIWDCDGVLVDSEALLKRAEVDALKAAGFDDVDEDACVRHLRTSVTGTEQRKRGARYMCRRYVGLHGARGDVCPSCAREADPR